MRVIRCTAVVLALLGLWCGSAAGRFMNASYVPVDRLIENATAYIAEEPNDASGYYTLARIHYLAFVNKAFVVGTFNEGVPPHVIPHWWWASYLSEARQAEAKAVALEEFGIKSTAELTEANRTEYYNRVNEILARLDADGWKPEQPTTEQLVEHSAAAQWNFYKAIALDPNNALYVLGQASLGEQYLEFFAETNTALMPPALEAIVRIGVKSTYLLAYDLSIEEDLQLEYKPIPGLHAIVSYEAGNAFVRLWEAEDEIPPDVQEKITAIKANLATLEALPFGAITPIVFSLEANASLADLLAAGRTARFDLDGDGRVELRPWLKPTTGFLVWDSRGDGRITSGRQMFGSVTWWLFFQNGYRAMDMLDNDRDGWLGSEELDGVSVWFDRNSNGISDAGEVVSTERLGIVGIATRPDGYDGDAPMRSAGLKLKDGRTLPTYDWIAPAAKP